MIKPNLNKQRNYRLTTGEIYPNLSPEDAIREFLNKWQGLDTMSYDHRAGKIITVRQLRIRNFNDLILTVSINAINKGG